MKRSAVCDTSPQQRPKVVKGENAASPRLDFRLKSPAGGAPLIFDFADVDWKMVAAEVLLTIKIALAHFDELAPVIDVHYHMHSFDANNTEELQGLVQKFNKAASTRSQLWKGQTAPGSEIADKALLKQICARAYNHSVTNVAALNKHYEAFSSETYGETSFERLQMIIEEIAPNERDVFVDLGSGVGQLIVQMAGGTRVKKAVGIEIASLPSRFAKQLEVQFAKWMKWFGKKYRPFEMRLGDFLDIKHRSLITEEATIIFINNYAFTAALDTNIKRQLLPELKDGTRIITTRPYALPGRSANGRQMNDISMILDVQEMKRCDDACSWTGKYVPYYIHTVNYSKIEKYYQKFRPDTLSSATTTRSRKPASLSSATARRSSKPASLGSATTTRSSKSASLSSATASRSSKPASLGSATTTRSSKSASLSSATASRSSKPASLGSATTTRSSKSASLSSATASRSRIKSDSVSSTTTTCSIESSSGSSATSCSSSQSKPVTVTNDSSLLLLQTETVDDGDVPLIASMHDALREYLLEGNKELQQN